MSTESTPSGAAAAAPSLTSSVGVTAQPSAAPAPLGVGLFAVPKPPRKGHFARKPKPSASPAHSPGAASAADR